VAGRCLTALPILFLAGFLGAAKKGSPPERARGETFSVPVPAGFAPATDARLTEMAPGGVVLVARKRAGPGWFIGSVVVTRVGPGPDFDPADPELCAEMAALMVPGGVVESHKIVKTVVGRTCQWKVLDTETHTRGATGTVLYKTRDNAWVMTCNYDIRDSAALKACKKALAGWKFDS
jgi:hypothetical protein